MSCGQPRQRRALTSHSRGADAEGNLCGIGSPEVGRAAENARASDAGGTWWMMLAVDLTGEVRLGNLVTRVWSSDAPVYGAVAQLVAHLPCMQGVRGSSPLGSTLRTRSEPLPSSMVSVRALLLSWAQVRALALSRRPSSGLCHLLPV